MQFFINMSKFVPDNFKMQVEKIYFLYYLLTFFASMVK